MWSVSNITLQLLWKIHVKTMRTDKFHNYCKLIQDFKKPEQFARTMISITIIRIIIL